jgi:hypothetical protein
MDELRQKKSAVADLIRKAESCIFSNNEDEALGLLEQAFEINQQIMLHFPEEAQAEFALIRINALNELCKKRKGTIQQPMNEELPLVAIALLNRVRALLLANAPDKAANELKAFMQRFPDAINQKADVASLCNQLGIPLQNRL